MFFKVATWNINSINVRLDQLKEFIKYHDPDVICLQELKCTTNRFPYEELRTLPYYSYVCGQKSYNGVAILSKIPSNQTITNFLGNPISEEARFIECSFHTKIGHTRVISLYAPNGGKVGTDKFKTKLYFYDMFIKYINSKKSFKEKLIIGSDYNIAPFDIDVYAPDKLRNTNCFTLVEQKKLRTILNNGFIDNFRAKHPRKKEFSWWDYRSSGFEQDKGMRIDTIISSSNLLQNLDNCIIDYSFRQKTKPSDHAPVVAIYNV